MTALFIYAMLCGCATSGGTVLGRAQPQSNVEVTYCNGGHPADYGPTLHFLVMRFETGEAAEAWCTRYLSPILSPPYRKFSVAPKTKCAWPKDMTTASLLGSGLGRLDRVYAAQAGREVWLEGWEE